MSGGQVDPEPPFVVPAKGRVVVGRGSGADLVLFDREVSREHFCVRHDGLEYFLDDLNSVNGTLVNGQPVEHSVNLKEGDTIQAGSISLRFTTREPEPEEQAEAPARPDQEEAEAGEAQVVHVPLRPVEGAAPGPPPRPVLAFRWWKLPLYPLLIPLALLLLPVQAVRTARWYRAAAAAHPDHTVRAFLQKHPKDTANKVFTWYQKVWYTAILLGLFVLFNYHALHFLHVFHALCTLYLIVILYKLVAVFLSVVHPGEIAVSPQEVAALGDEDLPVYTILVPLYREREVADKVIRHLGALDYPQEKLDVKLLLEPDDEETLEVCRRTRLPANYEIIVVPESVPKTKPKACNHGLERARGDYLVIYDAEDRPEPDQLKKAILAFRKANAPRTGLARLVRRTDTVCLQAKLNYFNPRQNLLTRWFTIEYSTWFDLFLPGLHHLGSPIPLGGTSNHFKTEVLQHIGGWDPYNVTEDCDLGIRLHKMGYSTRILDSTTWEEANSRVWNWVRQRSRWVKGYIQTHLVHMRNPFKTFWKLGPAGLFGFLSSVGGLSLMLLLNPIFWVIVLFYFACWAHDLSLVNWSWEAARELQRGYDPLQMRWPWERWLTWEGPWVWRMWFDDPEGNPFWNRWSQVFFVMTAVLFFANFLFVLMHLWACLRRRLYGLIPHALLTPFYWVLISLGAWKGLLQLFFKPFKWEKTHHGLDAGGGAP
ncbi:MAG: glycosyltransferase [Candidatus Brocadiia bacterium]